MTKVEDRYANIAQDQEKYIKSLGEGRGEHQRYTSGLKIYNNLTYPGNKPLIFHLYDQYCLLKRIPEKACMVLDQHPTISALEWFRDHTEECMREMRGNEWEELRSNAWDTDSIAHEEENRQIFWELSMSHKKEYFEKLLQVLQSRTRQEYGTGVLGLSEELHIRLGGIPSLNEADRKHVLKSILLQLPNETWDRMPSEDEMVSLLPQVDPL